MSHASCLSQFNAQYRIQQHEESSRTTWIEVQTQPKQRSDYQNTHLDLRERPQLLEVIALAVAQITYVYH